MSEKDRLITEFVDGTLKPDWLLKEEDEDIDKELKRQVIKTTEELNVFNAKRKLYVAMLQINPDELSEDNINIMYALSKDSDIQNYLEDALKAARTNSITHKHKDDK